MRLGLRVDYATSQNGTWGRLGCISNPTLGVKPQLPDSFLCSPSSYNLPFRSAWSHLVTRCYRLPRQHLDLSFPVTVLLPELNNEQREACWSGAMGTWATLLPASHPASHGDTCAPCRPGKGSCIPPKPQDRAVPPFSGPPGLALHHESPQFPPSSDSYT